jgi:hypothetical protein
MWVERYFHSHCAGLADALIAGSCVFFDCGPVQLDTISCSPLFT